MSLATFLAPAALSALCCPPAAAPAAPDPAAAYTRTADVIYGRRDGLALTLDVFAPKQQANGAGVLVWVSAKYRSGPEMAGLFQFAVDQFVARGYTVFAVTHGSQPRCTVVEIVEDAHRAVRFVRANAGGYGVDPDRLGAAGASSGGHLALVVGLAGRAGDPGAKDPVDRHPSRVAAVACFFPPTDLVALEARCPKDVLPAFDLREVNPATGRSEPVPAPRCREVVKGLSPVNLVTRSAAPTLIVHGDRDELVPVDQSRDLVGKLKACGVAGELVVKEMKRHYWLGMDKDVPALTGWFDKHLAAKR
jgi:acetyl esterase/lipase